MSNQNNVLNFRKRPKKNPKLEKNGQKKFTQSQNSWRLRGYLQLALVLIVFAYFMQLCHA